MTDSQAVVAQGTEQTTPTGQVVGSTPTGGTKTRHAVYTYEHRHDCAVKGDTVESKFIIEDDAFEKPQPLVCGVAGFHFGEDLVLIRTFVATI